MKAATTALGTSEAVQRPLKLLYLINGLGPGGAERSLAELLPFYLAAGVEPIVVCLKERDIGVEADVRLLGCDVRFLQAGRWWARVRSLRRMITSERVDLIHTTLFEADIIGRVAAIGTRIPVLSSFVNSGYEGARLQDPNVSRLRLRAVHLLDAATCHLPGTHFHAITHAVKDSVRRTLLIAGKRITVVERGRSRDRLGESSDKRRAQVRERLGLADDAEVVLNVARQEYQKGQCYLLEAAALLLRSRPNLVVLIAGREGHATPRLRSVCEELELSSDRVRFLGHRTDVPDLLAAADIFAFPSVYEGLGGALIESMAMCVPVIASDLPPLREVLEEGRCGILVPPAAPVELAAKIQLLLDDSSLRRDMVERGRRAFEERFTVERSAERMIGLYRTLSCPAPR